MVSREGTRDHSTTDRRFALWYHVLSRSRGLTKGDPRGIAREASGRWTRLTPSIPWLFGKNL